MQYMNITSEIGKLNRVMLHRPSLELESIVPDTMARLLFDDIPYLKIAQLEHDKFAEILRNNGVEVVYLENYLQDILNDVSIKKSLINDFVNMQSPYSEQIKNSIKSYYFSLPVNILIEKLFAGLRKDELLLQPMTLVDFALSDDMFYIDPLPNLYFTRDPGAVIGNRISISSMFKRARQAEPLFLSYICQYHENFKGTKTLYDFGIEHSIEGGDQLVLSKEVLAVGYSERSSSKGIELWAKNILSDDSNDFKKVLVIFIPKTRVFMHLDTVFTMVDYDKFTIHADAVGPMPIYELSLNSNSGLNIQYHDKLDIVLAKSLRVPSVKLLKCGNGDQIASGREQWNDGSNTLAISPGRVIVYDRNYVTNELLVNSGIEILEIPGAELSRGRGGPRCMSMPINRDNI